jgi:hypothetical protein
MYKPVPVATGADIEIEYVLIKILYTFTIMIAAARNALDQLML